MTEAPVVSVRGLTHTYVTRVGKSTAVADVSFDVGQAELVALVGPSGAGKTTVLRCVAGLLRPSGGDVLVQGNRVTGPPEGVAVVLQDYGRSLFGWLTVLGNVALPLRARGANRRDARARALEALEAVGLAESQRLHPWQLSGGMQQRVAIARALAYSPRLLLMDEPFASVDAQTRMDLEDLVQPLRHRYGVSVLLVTHDIDEAVYLADRVVVLSRPPSTVAREVPVPLPFPRTQVTTKEQPAFARLRREVLDLVRATDRTGLAVVPSPIAADRPRSPAGTPGPDDDQGRVVGHDAGHDPDTGDAIEETA